MSDDHERHVDPEQATLTGEAAGQERSEETPGFPSTVGTPQPTVTAGVSADGQGTTYYDRPAIKEPVWIWSVPSYFYTGGVSAGAAILAAIAQVADRDGYDGLITKSRWVGAVGGGLGTAFLIHDLGRPERFLNMLRVFRPTSAMNMGSWTLASATGMSSASAVLPHLGGGFFRMLGEVAGLGAGSVAPILGTYTGVLVADTAVPVWQETRRELPVLFGASAMASAMDILDLLGPTEREATVTRRLGVAAKVGELGAALALERRADEIPEVGTPLHEGVSGQLWTTAKALTGASLGVSLLPVPKRWRTARRVVSAVLGTIGAVVNRFAVFHAGKASARSPRATFAQQRSGHGAAEVTGRRAVTGPRR